MFVSTEFLFLPSPLADDNQLSEPEPNLSDNEDTEGLV